MNASAKRVGIDAQGLYAAPFTPMADNGDVAFDRIPALAEQLVRDGVRGVFVCGSNGEGPSMTIDERKRVAGAWLDAADGRLDLMVHVGHSSIREAQDLAAHAAEIGASAISAVPAFYFKPGSVESLVDCMAEIAKGAPDLPFYYYHIPTLVAVPVDIMQWMELAVERIPNLGGVKYTASTLWEYQACVAAYGDRYDVMFGFDEMLLPALSVGARVAIGSTYNFAAPLYLEVIRRFEGGDMAGARQTMGLLVEMVRVLLRYPPIPAQKAMMARRGHDLGAARLPLARLSDADAASLNAALDAIGFWTAVDRAVVERDAS